LCDTGRISPVLLSVFGINCGSLILIAAGKCDVCAREVPMDKEERDVSIREGGGVRQF